MTDSFVPPLLGEQFSVEDFCCFLRRNLRIDGSESHGSFLRSIGSPLFELCSCQTYWRRNVAFDRRCFGLGQLNKRRLAIPEIASDLFGNGEGSGPPADSRPVRILTYASAISRRRMFKPIDPAPVEPTTDTWLLVACYRTAQRQRPFERSLIFDVRWPQSIVPIFVGAQKRRALRMLHLKRFHLDICCRALSKKRGAAG